MVNDRSPNKRRGHRGHYKSHSLWEKVTKSTVGERLKEVEYAVECCINVT